MLALLRLRVVLFLALLLMVLRLRTHAGGVTAAQFRLLMQHTF
jgi:hypothetical protein